MLTHLIQSKCTAIVAELGYPYPDDVVISEAPAHVSADVSLNVAMQLASVVGKNPRELATELAEHFSQDPDITNVEIAGPGFLNLTLNDSIFLKALGSDLSETTQATDLKNVVVEYISANPTGPLHIGNARGGPIGESIARTLETVGHTVKRDFYVNDVGGQANKFARSVLHFYSLELGAESEFPEGGYPENVVGELAKEIARDEGDTLMQLPENEREEAMRKIAIGRQIIKIQDTAKRMGINFDTWSLQSELVTSGRSAATLHLLSERGSTFEKDGAVWLSGEMHDEDRETVLVKSDKNTTYFLDDIAFYRMKLEEWGNDYAVCVLGPGHIAHITRMKAALAAMGMNPERYHGTVYQNVQLKQDGIKIKMAKREGNFVSADQVLDEVPLDVFNYFLLSKASETHIDFDLQLAKDTSEKNPVYYIQYAYARICSVLTRVEEARKTSLPVPENYTFSESERALIRHLARFDTLVQDISIDYRVHMFATYLFELATRYHHFYAAHRILADNDSETGTRSAMSRQAAAVFKKGLSLLAISAPERMD